MFLIRINDIKKGCAALPQFEAWRSLWPWQMRLQARSRLGTWKAGHSSYCSWTSPCLQAWGKQSINDVMIQPWIQRAKLPIWWRRREHTPKQNGNSPKLPNYSLILYQLHSNIQKQVLVSLTMVYHLSRPWYPSSTILWLIINWDIKKDNALPPGYVVCWFISPMN